MAEPLSPIQKIDEVLIFVSSKYPVGRDDLYFYKSFNSVLSEIQRIDPSTEVSELEMILKKLMKDGYVDRMETLAREIVPKGQELLHYHYYKTFEGHLFTESGGYRQQELDRKANALRIRLENSQNQLNQRLLVIGAIGAAVGAIALVGWEMYKYFCLEHH